MAFIYLIFGHLAADFILQPAELVKWKYNKWQGIAVHSLIHFLFYLIVFFAYLPNLKVILVLFGLAVVHFVIDSIKINSEKDTKGFIKTFFIDQAMHLATIGVAGYLLMDIYPSIPKDSLFWSVYHNSYLVVGLSIMILVSYAAEVAKFQFIRKSLHDAKFRPDYGKMAKRVVFFSIIYALIMLFCVQGTAAMG